MKRGFRLLDLYCGGGGAAYGYWFAGFNEIVGVDIAPQPHYPFAFVQADALEYLAERGHEFDAIHASPPCQGYSIMRNLPWLRERDYPLLILPTLEMLERLGKPYVLENVMGARYGATGLTRHGLEVHGLKAGWLCGTMFNQSFYRHRLFATNWLWLAPEHQKHKRTDGAALAKWQNGNGAQAEGVGIGHAKGWRQAAEAMGIGWMTRGELTQAIPPCYTDFIGRFLLELLEQCHDGGRGETRGGGPEREIARRPASD